MNEEILRIQKMVAEGKITPEESVELIESLGFAGENERSRPPMPPPLSPPAGQTILQPIDAELRKKAVKAIIGCNASWILGLVVGSVMLVLAFIGVLGAARQGRDPSNEVQMVLFGLFVLATGIGDRYRGKLIRRLAGIKEE